MANLGTDQLVRILDANNPGFIAEEWMALRKAGQTPRHCDHTMVERLNLKYNIGLTATGFAKWRMAEIGAARSNAKSQKKLPTKRKPKGDDNEKILSRLRRIEDKLDTLLSHLQ